MESALAAPTDSAKNGTLHNANALVFIVIYPSLKKKDAPQLSETNHHIYFKNKTSRKLQGKKRKAILTIFHENSNS